MQPADFQLLSDLLMKRSGLALTQDKQYLLESRLLPIARSLQLNDLTALCMHIRTKPTEALLAEITEAMTTNESSFFRDIKPFEQFRQILVPMLMQSNAAIKSFRIWSAACSTGQEPYTLAMCLTEDAAKLGGWRHEIVASDLAKKVVDKARQGIYTQFEAQRGLPIQFLIKYFSQLPDTNWQIKDNIRAMVNFRQHNLLEDYGILGKFDLIFCRNVLIYFDDAGKAGVTERMARALPPHGILVLGATETLVDPNGRFVPMPELRGAYKLKA